jgi:hypothetical protein
MIFYCIENSDTRPMELFIKYQKTVKDYKYIDLLFNILDNIFYTNINDMISVKRNLKEFKQSISKKQFETFVKLFISNGTKPPILLGLFNYDVQDIETIALADDYLFTISYINNFLKD